MKDKKPKNPIAFPGNDGYNSGCPNSHEGMTLRDYFAAKALPSVMRDYNGTEKEVYDISKEEALNIAFYSYEIADAMLKQREI